MQKDNKYFADGLSLSNPRKVANASILLLTAYLRSLSDEKLDNEEYLIASVQEDDTSEVYRSFRVGIETDFWDVLIPRGFQQIWENISFSQGAQIIDLCEGAKIIFGEEPIKMVVGINRINKLSFLVNARMENFKSWLVNIGDHYCGAVKYLKSKDEYEYPIGVGYSIETHGVFMYRSPKALQVLSGAVPTAEENVLLDMMGCADPTEVPRFKSVAEEHKIDLAVFPADKFFMNLHRCKPNFQQQLEGRWNDC